MINFKDFDRAFTNEDTSTSTNTSNPNAFLSHQIQSYIDEALRLQRRDFDDVLSDRERLFKDELDEYKSKLKKKLKKKYKKKYAESPKNNKKSKKSHNYGNNPNEIFGVVMKNAVPAVIDCMVHNYKNKSRGGKGGGKHD